MIASATSVAMKKHNHTSDKARLTRFGGLVEREIVNNRTTLRRRIENDGFPRPLMLGKNSLAWRLCEIEDWLDERTTATAVARQ